MIGYGFMGRAHSNAYCKVGNFFDLECKPVLKAACGRTAENAQAFANNWGYESIETDWRKLIERKDIDAVDVCVPNNLHKEISLAAQLTLEGLGVYWEVKRRGVALHHENTVPINSRIACVTVAVGAPKYRSVLQCFGAAHLRVDNDEERVIRALNVVPDAPPDAREVPRCCPPCNTNPPIMEKRDAARHVKVARAEQR